MDNTIVSSFTNIGLDTRISAATQILFQIGGVTQFSIAANSFRDASANQLLGVANAGWTAMTGTATKGGFDTGTVTLVQLAQVGKALLDGLMAQGLFRA